VLDRVRPGLVVLPVAVAPLIAAIGWSVTTRAASLVALAALVVTATVAAVIARSDEVRVPPTVGAGAASALLSAVVTRAAGAGVAPAAFAAAVAGLVVLLVGAALFSGRIEGLALEWTGGVAVVAAAFVAATGIGWLAGILTVAAPVLVLAALVQGERARTYGTLAGIAAVVASWSWLGAAHVGTVEAYTAPAAAFALGLGLALWQRGPARSWVALGPAIVLALGPTLLIGIADGDAARDATVAVIACAVVVAGAWKRLQAPLVLGTTALLALAVDILGPAVASLPRWIPPAVAGLVLMWIGATFETRRERARRMTHHMMQLG
jgi:xanthine/uracil permease